MNWSWKKILLASVLVDFTATTAYAVYQHGLAGIAEAATANMASIALTADLVVALSLIAVWMYRDARARGVSPLPYLLLTAGLGSVGPLVYLLRRDEEEAPVPLAAAPQRAA